MKRYFLIAKDVGDLTAIVCAALEARHAKPATGMNRFVGRLKRTNKAIKDTNDFVIENERLTVVNDSVFQNDPVNLIRIFYFADKLNRAIHPHATRVMTQSLRFIDTKLRNSPEANRLFLEILTSKETPEITLRRMNEAGVLGKFVPEFGRVVAMMQFNMYHHYTVDEHTLRAVEQATSLERDGGVLGEAYRTLHRKWLLHLALLLHDLGKGALPSVPHASFHMIDSHSQEQCRSMQTPLAVLLR